LLDRFDDLFFKCHISSRIKVELWHNRSQEQRRYRACITEVTRDSRAIPYCFHVVQNAPSEQGFHSPRLWIQRRDHSASRKPFQPAELGIGLSQDLIVSLRETLSTFVLPIDPWTVMKLVVHSLHAAVLIGYRVHRP